MKRVISLKKILFLTLVLSSGLNQASAFNLATLNAPPSCNICITTFASNFPFDPASNAGPFGIAFLPDGKVLVSSVHPLPLSKLYLFPSDTDSTTAPPNCLTGAVGFNAPSFEVGFNRGTLDHDGAIDLAVSFDGRIFATGSDVNGTGVLVNLTYDPVANSFTAGAPLDSGGFGGGMAVDHVSGFILYDMGGNQIRAFDPTANTASVLTSGGFVQMDGMDVSADGRFLWVADVGANTVTQFTFVRDGAGHPVSLVSPQVQCSGLPGADGIARGVTGSCLQNFLFCNTNGGTIVQRDLVNNTCSTFLSGGSRGDFVKVSCKGWLYATQTDNIAIIREANGGPLFECSSGPVPGTPTPTGTPVNSLTSTMTDTPTSTPILDLSITFTPTRTFTPTPMLTITATITSTPTFTPMTTGVPTLSPTACADAFGNSQTAGFLPVEGIFFFNSISPSTTTEHIAASQYHLPVDGTLTSISAVFPVVTPVPITNGAIRMAVYSNSAGTPGSLIVESAPVPFTTGQTLYTAPILPTSLPAGDYWLAVQGEVVGTLPFSNGQQFGELLLAYAAPGNGVNEDWTFGPFPSTFAPTTATGKSYVIFANYCPGSTATTSPTATATLTSTPTSTAIPSSTPTMALSVTATPTATPALSLTASATMTKTATPTTTPTATSSLTSTPTLTSTCPVVSHTPTPTHTPERKCHPIPFPNPCHGEPIHFRCGGGPYDEIHYMICTMDMRRVCHRVQPCHGEEESELTWDLRDDKGGTVANGVYFLVVDTRCRSDVRRYIEKILVLR